MSPALRRLRSLASLGPSSSASTRVSPSVDANPAPPLVRAQSSRTAQRRGATIGWHRGERRSSLNGFASVSPTRQDLTTAKPAGQGRSFLLQPTAPAFPASPKARLARTASAGGSMTVEFQRQLFALFGVCDGDDDGSINQRELVVLLEVLGMTAEKAHEMVSQKAANSNALLTYISFIKTYQVQLETCASTTPFRRPDFILRCKRLKHGLRKADTNGDTMITKGELEIALQKLNFVLSDHDLDRVFHVLDRDGDGSIEWCEFVHAAWQNTLGSVAATMSEPFSIEMLADLPSLFRPVTRSATTRSYRRLSLTRGGISKSSPNLSGSSRRSLAERHASVAKAIAEVKSSLQRRHISESVSAVERLGVEYMTRVSKERLSVVKKTAAESTGRHGPGLALVSAQVSPSLPTLQRRQTTKAGFLPAVRRQIRSIEAIAVLFAAAIGLLCGLIATWLESIIALYVEDTRAIYFVYVVLMTIGVSIVEVHGMYAIAIVSAIRLTVCTDLKLYPLDAEREFLVKSIARAALQVGIRKEKLFGIDPMKNSPRIVLWLTLLMFKSKRYALKSLLKLLLKRVVWRAAAKSMLNLMVIPINAIMDAWTLRRVMRNCRVNIIGPPCVVTLCEAFFLHDDDFSPLQRVDYMRVIGCVVAAKRCIHPNVEIMIDHLRHQWLRTDLWPTADGCICMDTSNESCPRHVLDDVELLTASLRLYASQLRGSASQSARQHLHNMYILLIVTLLIDGGVDRVKRRLYNRLCQAGHMQNAWKDVVRLKDDFVAGKGIHASAVSALVQEIHGNAEDEDQQAWQQVPCHESLQYAINRIAQYLVL